MKRNTRTHHLTAAIITLLHIIFVPAQTHAEPSYTVSTKHDVLQELSTKFTQMHVGNSIDTFSFTTVAGKTHSLRDVVKAGPAVFAFLSTECPVARRYTTRLKRLHDEFSHQNVTIVGVYPNAGESREDVARLAQDVGFPFPIVRDIDGHIARHLRATMTPQVFVIDQNQTVRYRGAIDDNRYENRVLSRYLCNALTALLSGESVKITETPAFGCTVHLPQQVTYAQHVAPILQKHCQSCHRPFQVAPFSLLTYSDARMWATEIAHYTQTRLMPPWKPEDGYGNFQKSRRMADADIDLITQWVASGTRPGNLDQAPPAPTFSDGWALGEPDFIVEMPQSYEIKPEGEDEYRHFVIETNFDQDIFVEAVDIEPENPQVVHHVLIYIDTTGTARKLDAADPLPGYATSGGGAGFEVSGTLGGWAPGTTPTVLPQHTGYLLPAGADIVLQVHYYRTGQVERDQSRAGLYFSKAAHPKPVYVDQVINTEFTIPPGEKWYEVRGETILKTDIDLLGIAPHMHLLGREMKVTATAPNGQVIHLIWIKDWDFNWQDIYNYKEPIFLPHGTRIGFVAHFDNSAQNPRNPHNPPQPVSWGEKTTDEMAIAFFHYVKASDFHPKMPHLKH